MNVPDLGLGGMGATLAARFLSNPGVVLLNGGWNGPGPWIAYLPSFLGSDFYATGPFFKNDPDANFPYGWAVEPDVHL